LADGSDFGVKVGTERAEDALMESNFPAVSKPLLDRLNELFPEKCPDLDWEDREIWFRVGQRSVVAMLSAEYERQTRDS
jgi:hypothetical protein